MLVAERPKIYRSAESVSPHVKRWTTDEYNDLVERGAIRGKHIFLHRGEILEMPPMGALHRIAIININRWLTGVLPAEFFVQIQLPVITPGESVPEPDASVVTQTEALRRPHPTKAELVVEVSDSSLDFDHEKAFDYAAAQVPEYWIIDVNSRSIEIHRDPIPDASAPLGYRYASHRVAREEESIASLLRPDAIVSVKSLLATK